MGIPSFYKHIIESITGVTSKVRATSPQFFGLDLNCAIYHCVKKVQRITPYTPANQHKWEDDLVKHVIAYIKQMRGIVNPTETLYIAVDGVAPMAKIKQQRMRRFKSAIGAETESRIKAEAQGIAYEPAPRWDTNAITPGTVFMTNLATALREYAKTDPAKIIVSPADIPGEGEQKRVEFMRAHKPADAVIYGLDADLIVLALWTSHTLGTNIDLFREDVEFSGAIKENIHGGEEYLYLNIKHLANAVFSQYVSSPAPTSSVPLPTLPQFVQDFVGLMNLLGNDFVPHGMALKIRAGGIPILLEQYMKLPRPIVQLSSSGTWEYNPVAIQAYFDWLVTQEPQLMLEGIKKKFTARVGATPSRDPVDQAMARYNDTPVEWKAERDMVHYVRVPGLEAPQLQLKPTWREVYEAQALGRAEPELVTKTYLESLSWTLAYYSGTPVDTHWYYPWFLPPLTGRITEYLKKNPMPSAPTKKQPHLTPTEQLAMVLPESSFHLLPTELHVLPKQYPWAWPVDWPHYSYGRRFMWECEPLIPLIQPRQIKQWIEAALD
jgi:5'-3' exonuclease